jgi:hypothetical protein
MHKPMTEHILKTTVPPPEGWEYQGEFRPAKDEWYRHGQSAYQGTTDYPVAILRRARWVPKQGDVVWLWSPRYGVAQVRHDGDLFEAQISFKTKEEAVRFGAEVVALAERMHGEDMT